MKLIYIKNISPNVELGIQPNETLHIWFNWKFMRQYGEIILDKIDLQIFEGYDDTDTLISAADIWGDILTLRQKVALQPDPLLWNMAISQEVIAYVRRQMITIGLTPLGMSATSMLSKLSNVVMCLTVGMFVEAATILQYAILKDAFLTDARCSLYANMVKSADAID